MLIAPLVLAIFDRSGLGATIPRFRWLYGVAAGLVAAALGDPTRRPELSPRSCSARTAVDEGEYDLGEVLQYLGWHIAELSLYLLVIPLAATIVLVGRARSLDPPLQAFLAATVALTVCLVPVVAAFASRFSQRIEERNLFYVAPLFLIPLSPGSSAGQRALECSRRPQPSSPRSSSSSPSPSSASSTTPAITDTLMLLPLWSLQDRIGDGSRRSLLFAASSRSFLFVPRRYALVLPLLVLGLWAVPFDPIWSGPHGFRRLSAGALFQGIRGGRRDWIDRAQPLGRARCFPLDGSRRPLDREPERVLQPGRRARVLRHRSDTRRLPETRVKIDRERAVTLAGGVRSRTSTCSPTPRSSPTAKQSLETTASGVHSGGMRRSYRPRIDRPVSERHLVGETVTYMRRQLPLPDGSRCRCRATRVSSSSRKQCRASNGAVVGRVLLPQRAV